MARSSIYFSWTAFLAKTGDSKHDVDRTIPLTEADEKLRQAIEGEKLFYPKEYAEPVHPDPSGASSIVGSHTLIPQALYHAFSTFGALMSPELPLIAPPTRDDCHDGLGNQPMRVLNRVSRRVSA